MLTLLLFCSMLSPVFPIITGSKTPKSLMWYYVVTSMTFDILAYLFKHYFKLNYYLLGNLFVLFEFIYIYVYYKDRFRNRYIYGLSALLFSIIFIATTLYKSAFIFNSTGISILYLYYVVLTLACYYNLLTGTREIFIEKLSFFWVNTAFFLYASGSFFIFLFQELLKSQDVQKLAVIWSTLFLSLNILKNILLGIALSKKE